MMIKTNNSLRVEVHEDTLRVALEGEIDHHSAVATRGEIDRLIYEHRPKRLELELSRIGFMDSSGLGLVMGRYTLVKDLGGELILVDPSPAILRIFKLAGMDRLLRIEQSTCKTSPPPDAEMSENTEGGSENNEKKESD